MHFLQAQGLVYPSVQAHRLSVCYFNMDEIEKFFKCPYCLEKISMVLDVSVGGLQSYIEDCEVCCNPIQLTYDCENNKIRSFTAQKI